MTKLWFRFLFILFFIAPICSQKVYPQTGGISQDQLRTLAFQAYSGERYNEAAKYFSLLLDRFPKDPKYHYYTAVSLIQSRTGLPRAIDLLDFPALSLQFPDADLQKAEAYFLLYRFTEAENLCRQVSENRDAERLIRETAETWIQMIGEARTHTGQIQDVGVYDRSFQDFRKGLVLSGKDTLYYAPLLDPVFLRLNGLYPDSMSRIVNPGSIPMGAVACFAARTGKKSDLNIYRVNRTGVRSWSKPEKLGTGINSAADESFAWFDNTDSTLYFISNRKESMGGGDIFISRLARDGQWSTPRNPGFPVNTVAGEKAFILLKKHHVALIVSDRQTSNDLPGSYLISWPPEKGSKIATNPDSLLALSLLPVKKLQNQDADEKPFDREVEARKETGKGSYQKPARESRMSASDDQDYMTLLNDALRLQLKADSLFREAEITRERLNSTSNPSDRQQLQQTIRKCSTGADQLQGEANAMYSRAREMELHYLQQVYPEGDQNKAVNSKENEGKQSTLANGIKENNKADFSSAQKHVNPIDSVKGNSIALKPFNSEPKRSRDQFAILSTCPYNEKNPVPPVINGGKGVIYRIQLGVFSKPVAVDRFQGISPLFYEKLPENGLTKYYAGEFETIIAAENALAKIKDYGFREAFIVSYFQGNKISLIRARELEQMIKARELNP